MFFFVPLNVEIIEKTNAMLDTTIPEIHPDFKLNGHHCNVKELYSVAYSFIKEGLAYEELAGNFLLDWLNESYDSIKLRTSGSTGEPKEIYVSREKMIHSAMLTANCFKMPAKSQVLCCIPANNVAGRMMLVRAMILGWHLDMVEPKVNALESITKNYDFCALTPFQLSHSLHKLHLIRKLIVGGAPVSLKLKSMLRGRSTKVYETFGMTETVSHVAYKRINSMTTKEAKPFKSVGGVHFSVDERNCLVIHSEELLDETLVTNDVVELVNETTFFWKGRLGNVINSGGVKIHPEQVEKKLQQIIETEFIVAPSEDEKLGEKVILLVKEEEKLPAKENLLSQIKSLEDMGKFEVPKEIHYIADFARTRTGKIDRLASVEALHQLN